MNKVLLRDNIEKFTCSGDLKSIKDEIKDLVELHKKQNIPIVVGRDFIQDRTVYFIYAIEEGFSVLELEQQVDNFLQGKFNEV